MTSDSTIGLAGHALKALAIGAALACGAGASLAADNATINITSFSVSTAEFSDTFAIATDAYQSFNLSALDAAGLHGSQSDTFQAANWDQGLNRLAQTSYATAAGNTVAFTDAMTQLTTGGFNLSAGATLGATTPLPNIADAGARQSGAFTLLDANGAATAGTITFDVYYNLSVLAPDAAPSGYSKSVLSLLSAAGSAGSYSVGDSLLSGDLAGGAGSTSGHFTWSYSLAAGQAAYYTLSGSALAVAAVPEPGTYALMSIGLVGVAALARRRRRFTA